MDLKTKYLGMTLRSPLVVAASPITEDPANIKKLEDAGAAAIVLHSLFEEQIRHEQKEFHYHTTAGTYSFAESLTFFPDFDSYRLVPDAYLEHIRKAKAAVQIPIIASLNGSTPGGWTGYAKKMEEAGADALELNVYFIPTDFDMTGEEVEKSYIDILKSVKSAVKIPVAMKIGPFFSNMANMAKKFDEAGADALVLFNRFYQPDIDLEELNVNPHIQLSSSFDARLPLTWIGILKNRIKADLAATRGVHHGTDAIKLLMAGANVTQLCSVLLKNGPGYIATIEKEMIDWMTEKEYVSVEQMQGSLSHSKMKDPSGFERALYMRGLTNYKF